MSSQAAQIVGKVEYGEGDGTKMPIPRGPVEVELTINDATLSWVDGETHGSAAMPLSDFKRYCSEGAIVLAGAAATPAGTASGTAADPAP